MKQIILVSLALMLVLFLFPLAVMPDEPLLSGLALVETDELDDGDSEHTSDYIVPFAEDSGTPPPEPEETLSFDANTYVTVIVNDEMTELSLKDYLRGVMAGEVPASFPEEALKAQAVAARTYIMRNPAATFIDDPSTCMAYSDKYDPRLDAAVENTDGEVLMYDGEPILAVFFSTSSGKTENAADVWGGEYPYLVAVDSIGEDDSPGRHASITVDLSDFWAALDGVAPSETPFGTVARTPSGGVSSIEISGVEVKGTELRALFGLNSTNFTVAIINGKVVFETVGYGHGVGMPQYGACAMALEGAGYEEILRHYYTGAEMAKLSPVS
ncbi:MAG: SpoIID/LytB domain-containing protein [Oscillospiraceae bacterium]|nr:SpoIID/LytB domain-containing protein [Oscillospiraceae bacterium]